MLSCFKTAGIHENIVKTRLMLAVHREITMTRSVLSEDPVTVMSPEVCTVFTLLWFKLNIPSSFMTIQVSFNSEILRRLNLCSVEA